MVWGFIEFWPISLAVLGGKFFGKGNPCTLAANFISGEKHGHAGELDLRQLGLSGKQFALLCLGLDRK